jgi:hypothetical protein
LSNGRIAGKREHIDGILRGPVGSGVLISFVVALAVLGVSGYLMRRFNGGNLAVLGRRGRQPRLAVIDAASVDGSRRLVLVISC